MATGLVRPKQTAGSNLLYAISNVAYQNSNNAYPVLNVSTYSSNQSAFNSNTLYPRNAFTSNIIIANSNESYAQHTFASNLGAYSSNSIVTLCNVTRASAFFSCNAAVWSCNVNVFSSNLGVTNSNHLFPILNFVSNAAVSSSNMIEGATGASNSIYTMSNTLYPASVFACNAAVLASNTGAYNSNLAVQSSNAAHPLALFSSNTACFGSNHSVYTSTLILSISNVVLPNTVYSSNAIAYALSNADMSSNVTHGTSNFVYQTTVAAIQGTDYASNLTMSTSNAMVGTSNAAFTRTVFSSVTENFASAHSSTTSNYLSTALATFASNAAAFGSNHAAAMSNALVASSNVLFPQAAFTNAAQSHASTLSVALSNALYPASVGDSNRAAHTSNLSFSNDTLFNTGSNQLFVTATFTSNAAAHGSSLAHSASNMITSSSNYLFPTCTWLAASAPSASSLSVSACNASVSLSNSYTSDATAASNRANHAAVRADTLSNAASSEALAVTGLLTSASNLLYTTSNVAHAAAAKASFTSNLVSVTSNTLFPVSWYVSSIYPSIVYSAVDRSNAAVSASNTLHSSLSNLLRRADGTLSNVASASESRSNLGFHGAATVRLSSLTLSEGGVSPTPPSGALSLVWAAASNAAKAAVVLETGQASLCVGHDSNNAIVRVSDRRVNVTSAPVTFMSEMSTPAQLAVLSETSSEGKWPSAPFTIENISNSSCNIESVYASTVALLKDCATDQLAAYSAGRAVPVPVHEWSASLDTGSSDTTWKRASAAVQGALFVAAGSRTRNLHDLYDSSNCPVSYTVMYPYGDEGDHATQGNAVCYAAQDGRPKGVSGVQGPGSSAILSVGVASDIVSNTTEVVAAAITSSACNLRITSFDGFTSSGVIDFGANIHAADPAPCCMVFKYAEESANWVPRWATALSGGLPARDIHVTTPPPGANLEASTLLAGTLAFASNACSLHVSQGAASQLMYVSTPASLQLAVSDLQQASNAVFITGVSTQHGVPGWLQLMHLGSNGCLVPPSLALQRSPTAHLVGTTYNTFSVGGYCPVTVQYVSAAVSSASTVQPVPFVKAAAASNIPCAAVFEMSSPSNVAWTVSIPGAALTDIAAQEDGSAYISCTVADQPGCCNLWMHRQTYAPGGSTPLHSSNLVNLSKSDSAFERLPGEQGGGASFVTKINSTGGLVWTTRLSGPAQANVLSALRVDQATQAVIATGYCGPDAPCVARSSNVALDSKHYSAVPSASGASVSHSTVDASALSAPSRYSSFVLHLDAATGAVRSAASVMDGAKAVSMTLDAQDVYVLSEYGSNINVSTGPRASHGLAAPATASTRVVRGASGGGLCVAKHVTSPALIYTLKSPQANTEIGRRKLLLNDEDAPRSIVRVVNASGTEVERFMLMGTGEHGVADLVWTGHSWVRLV